MQLTQGVAFPFSAEGVACGKDAHFYSASIQGAQNVTGLLIN